VQPVYLKPRGSKKIVTSDTFLTEDLSLSIIPAAQRAGAAVMQVYHSNPNVRYKADRSPVTDADHASEDIILEALAKLAPEIPVIAEEQLAAGNIPDVGTRFFLVDPLDGTKEFIKANGEFTINIALIEGRKPVFGLIYAPDKDDCYITLRPDAAARFKLTPASNPHPRQKFDFEPLSGVLPQPRSRTAIVSRSHLTPETEAFLHKLGNPQRILLGSSLKFCILARGEADVYPRFAPTSEWDTAAGHAILNATGGGVLAGDGEPFFYGKQERRFTNPSFVAWRRICDAEEAHGHEIQ
jgi:3'(2'), 5'-bisphosphate nucleotidase